jgi:O-antigen/teichoic acid export membrane protein
MVRSYQLRTLDRKIAFSTFIQYGGKALQLLMSVVSIKLISGFLTEEGYGFYATMTEFALFLSTMANLGIFGNTVRKMADAPQDVGIFGNMLILRMVTAGLFFILGIFWLMTTGASGAFILGVGLFLGSLFFDYVTVVCDGMLQVNYLMGRATFALVAGKVLNLVFLLLFQSSLGVDAEWVFLGVFLGSLLTMVLSLKTLERLRVNSKPELFSSKY